MGSFFFLVASFGRLHAPNKGRIGAGRGHLHTKNAFFPMGNSSKDEFASQRNILVWSDEFPEKKGSKKNLGD